MAALLRIFCAARFLHAHVIRSAPMNIKQPKTFLAVVENKSFAAAGDKIGLSPSAVSLQIKAMENELGVLLFDRVKRPPVTKATFWVEEGTAGIIIDKAINMATSGLHHPSVWSRHFHFNLCSYRKERLR